MLSHQVICEAPPRWLQMDGCATGQTSADETVGSDEQAEIMPLTFGEVRRAPLT